ncbi:MAG: double-strand break repair helicase AddA, partial [Sphingomonadaceae bacterium]|nr:double-strand break repair helicase AddA [Sphingomonadaceae bacterium]
MPEWAINPAAAEARPSRPLAPSALGVEDKASSPPPDPAMRDAARRGSLLHGLFERLPAVRPEDRHLAATHWLTAQQADDVEGLIATALSIIDHPDFAHVFAAEALAEAPLAGVVNGDVISGAVDR